MSPPWMPLYIGDYLADTAHLRAIEHGGYLLLVMHYWRNGALPDDDASLARITRMTAAEWRRARPVIEAFFQEGWKHKRIEFELTEAARISEAGRRGGVASGEARRAKSQRSANDVRTTDERPFNDHGNDSPTIREALHSPSPKKDKNAADAASTNGKYAFESGVVRLNLKDFSKWKQAFSYLDLAAELIALAPWAEQQPKWFHAVSGALAKRNREEKLRRERPQSGQLRLTPSGNPWPEGID